MAVREGERAGEAVALKGVADSGGGDAESIIRVGGGRGE